MVHSESTVFEISPENWRDALSLPFIPVSPPVLHRTNTPTFPCAAYCTYGRRFYTILSYLAVTSPSETRQLADFFSTKYGATPSPNFRVVSASLEFPFRLFNFDGARLPQKPRTERVQLIDEFLVFLESEISISKFPVSAYWDQRAVEARTLLARLVPAKPEIASPALIASVIQALTSKNAKLGDTHYERLEFLGDATLTLLLSLSSPNMGVFNERKSNFFLDRVARNFRLQEFVQDTAPTVNRRITLASRGLQHEEAKKVLADVVEATLGALVLNLDLDACFHAGKTLGIFDEVVADHALAEEFAIAYGKLVGTLAVFRKFPNISVGELHLEREQIVGNRKSRDFLPRHFDPATDTLQSLDAEIRAKADHVLAAEATSPLKKRLRPDVCREPGTLEEATEAVTAAEGAVEEARQELEARLAELDEARSLLSRFSDLDSR